MRAERRAEQRGKRGQKILEKRSRGDHREEESRKIAEHIGVENIEESGVERKGEQRREQSR